MTKKEKISYFTGEFIGSGKGFAFVRSDQLEGDIFIRKKNAKTALHRDIVKFKIINESEGALRAEGVITDIIKRHNVTIIGTFSKSKKKGLVIADDKRISRRILVEGKNINSARDGQKVVCKIISYGDKNQRPQGRIIKVIGYANENGNDIRSIMLQYNLPEKFPANVLKEAQNIGDTVPEEISKTRLDLRNDFIITIDGADAKDLDDAISCKITEDGNYLLGVHIADVSHYVRENSELNKEAYNRGTSVYLVDRVIPMLPPALSNGICSLNPDADRLTMSVFMTIDKNGGLLNRKIVPSVIRSKYRMTYDRVTEILDGAKEKDKTLKSLLFLMCELAVILRRKRKARGSLDFNFPECKVVLDEDNRPVEINRYNLTISNYIIEEFMLAANETVAEYIHGLNKPSIYRIHENPEPDKINAFLIMAKNLGYKVNKKGDIRASDLLSILDQCKGEQTERVVQTVMLRSLMKAKYTSVNKGHFGLAAEYYCHFTSPIRRYPDLVVHRILKLILDNKFNDELEERMTELVAEAAYNSSLREQDAENAERDTVSLKKAEYMLDKIGETYEGIISSITGFGMFAELDNTVEGLIRFSDLEDDYYEFDPVNYQAIGVRTKNRYTIGERVLVTVTSANPLLKEINFSLIKKMEKKS